MVDSSVIIVTGDMCNTVDTVDICDMVDSSVIILTGDMCNTVDTVDICDIADSSVIIHVTWQTAVS